jgi:serine/threonine-protein kinase
MACLDEETLLDFLAGRLDGATTARAREHVAQCSSCNAVATDLISGAAAQVRTPTAKGYELVAGALVAEKYRLVRALGEGGMGVVWEAEAPDGSRVAIKLLKAFDAAAKKRFAREIGITSALSDPGLVRVVDVLEDVEAGCPALVMELLPGTTLAQAEDVDVGLVGLHLARTLAVVHRAGLVHRDVKPANVGLLPDPARPVVLLDLGLAKAMGTTSMTRITRTGHVVGTPAYMAPEQLAGETAIDGRADLWSLGVILYERLFGARPFAGSTVAEVLRSALRGPPAFDRSDARSALIHSLLQVDREARPASASEVAAALELNARRLGQIR